MRFQVKRVDLGELFGWKTENGAPIYIEYPQGLLEGFFRDINEIRGVYPDDYPDEKLRGEPKDPGGVIGNLMFLDLVTDWNFDDEKGAPVPLTSSIKPGTKANDEKRSALLAKLPLGMIPWLVTEVMAIDRIREKTQDFSKTSSAE